MVQSKGSLLVCLVFFWAIVGPNLFGFERTVDAAIAFRGVTTATTGTSGATSLTINKPAAAIEGDVLVATVTTGISNDSMNISSPGWTAVYTNGLNTTFTGSGSGHVYTQTYTRTVPTFPQSSYTFSVTTSQGSNSNIRMTAAITAYSGVDTLNPIDISSTRAFSSAVSNYPSNQITTTDDGAVIVGGFGVAYAPAVGCDAISPSNPGTGSHVLGVERAEECAKESLGTSFTVQVQDFAQSTVGPVSLQATSSSSARAMAQVLALRAAKHNFNLSAYRWYANINSIDFLGVSHDAGQDSGCTNSFDQALSVEQHPTQNWVMIAGFDACNDGQWNIQKRSVLDGGLVEEFGTLGIITHNGGRPGMDKATSIERDNDGFIYIGGYEMIRSGPVLEEADNTRWRIEKRNAESGALIAGFGAGGIITSDPAGGSGKNDYLHSLYVDTTSRVLYAVGEDSTSSTSGDTRWRIEKYNMDTGSKCDGSIVNGSPVCVGGEFGAGGVITVNPTGNADAPISVFVDENAGIDANSQVISYLYIGGYQSPGSTDKAWRLEKRYAHTGALCSSSTTCPEGGFNSGTGIYVINPTANNGGDDRIATVEVEVVSQSIKNVYLGGRDKSGGNTQWRMEKLDAITGALKTDFGTGGVITSNPDSNDDDTITSFSVDSADNILYIVGTDGGGGSTNNAPVDYRWRVEKRNSVTGALCDGGGTETDPTCWYQGGKASRFGANPDPPGVATSNPVDGSCGTSDCISRANDDYDAPLDMIIDTLGDALFLVGFDRAQTATTGDSQWRLEKRNLEDGTRQFDMSPIAAQDTRATPFRVNMSVRLRLLLHIEPTSMFTTDSNVPQFKLQFAEKVETCDTSFIGESYIDVQVSDGLLRWLDNEAADAVSGAIPRDLGSSDPHHTVIENNVEVTHDNSIQGYYESNPFTVGATLPGATDGLWDFALKDVDAFGSYCLRVVYDDGTPEGKLLTEENGGYTKLPEIDFCIHPPMDKLLRHGSYFCGNIENPFYWSASFEL